MKILLISLGGTIAMERGESGGLPKNGAAALAERLDSRVLSGVNLEVEEFCNLPSGSLDFELLGGVLKAVQNALQRGVEAIIITQGSDTIEESSFFFNLFWKSPAPCVFVAAMRMQNEAGYDGLWHLESAILVAKAKSAKNRGVLVVFADKIYSPNWLRKISANFIAAFDAPHIEGVVLESCVRFFAPPLSRMTFELPKTSPRILFLEQNLGETNEILEKVAQNYDGVVVCGVGSGHIHAESMAQIRRLSALKIPLVVASRCGFATKNTYGYAGSEVDLQKNGALMSGMLDARKARILLWCVLGRVLGAGRDLAREGGKSGDCGADVGLALEKFSAFEKSLTM